METIVLDYTKTPGLDLVKNRDNMAVLNYMEDGIAYYSIKHGEDGVYMFPVNMFNSEDVGTADFDAYIKALTMMRYVRKAIADGTLVPACTMVKVTAGTLYYTVRIDGSSYVFSVDKRDKGTNRSFHRIMGIDKLIRFIDVDNLIKL